MSRAPGDGSVKPRDGLGTPSLSRLAELEGEMKKCFRCSLCKLVPLPTVLDAAPMQGLSTGCVGAQTVGQFRVVDGFEVTGRGARGEKITSIFA